MRHRESPVIYECPDNIEHRAAGKRTCMGETMKRSFAVIVGVVIFTTLLVSVRGQNRSKAGPEPLTLQALNNLLRGDVGRNMTEADLIERIERFGIAFVPTPDAVSLLRKSGGRQHLINVIKREADKLSADMVVTTDSQTADPFIEEAGKVARDYLDELPDFICQLIIQRYDGKGGSGAWQENDILAYELAYDGKSESYNPISRSNRYGVQYGKSALKEINGAYSKGQFASALRGIFGSDSKAIFKPAGRELLGGRETILYDFRMPAEFSTLAVSFNDRETLYPGYSGTVWIDAETKNVLRVSRASDDLPRDHPVSYGEDLVEYQTMKLRGRDGKFLLPARAEIIIAVRSPKRHFRNVMFFKNYRKFETDIKIGGDVTLPQKAPR
jgi:hypothetical protein